MEENSVILNSLSDAEFIAYYFKGNYSNPPHGLIPDLCHRMRYHGSKNSIYINNPYSNITKCLRLFYASGQASNNMIEIDALFIVEYYHLSHLLLPTDLYADWYAGELNLLNFILYAYDLRTKCTEGNPLFKFFIETEIYCWMMEFNPALVKKNELLWEWE